MSKHLDWSRITPDTVIWCQTAEEDEAFRQACEERGMTWLSGAHVIGVIPFQNDMVYKAIDTALHIQVDAIRKNATIYSSLLIEDKPAKSRLAEILGVDDDEEWWYEGMPYRVHNGARQYKNGDGEWECCRFEEHALSTLIDHINLIIRKPRFAADEMAMLRCFKAAGVESIKRDNDGILLVDADIYGGPVYPRRLLPSLLTGQSIELAEVLG